MRHTVPLHRMRMLLLLNVLLLISARTKAQRACGATQSKPIRVENAAGVDVLRAAVNCTNGGAVRADWVSIVTVDSPIAVGEGTFLSVTGEDTLSEVRGGGSATRLFQVSPGGSLMLTRVKLSGGSAEDGGAIHSESATLTLDNCTFDGNVATGRFDGNVATGRFDANDVIGGNGGAVWAEGGSVTIVGGQYLANNATRYGGAVYVVEGRLVVQGGARLQDNTAEAGGALFCGTEEEIASKPSAYCSITDANFVSNSALKSHTWVGDRYYSIADSDVDTSDNDGGGAAMFQSVGVEITDSVFTLNHATLLGGALHGGIDTNVSVNGCTFRNNTSDNYGGAISAFSLTLGGSTELVHNLANHGGSVFGFDVKGTIVLSDVICEHNSADYNGGCFYGSGRTIVDEGTVMLDNAGSYGGSLYAAEGSDVSVRGGTFTSRSCDWGGFLYAAGGTRVNITGGLFEKNIVTRRGGALYVNGDEESDIIIEGGTFRNNKANEMGGAIAASGAAALVTITGGRLESNQARFHGGCVFLELEASFTCDGVAINGNSAGGQGGGLYAREATWVNSSCDLIANESHEGAAMYLTNVKSSTFKDKNVADNVASGGIVVFATGSAVVARNVTFKSSGDVQEQFFNRAVQLVGNTTLEAERCVFDGWLGDTVIFHQSSADGSLVLNNCDFSGSSAMSAVVSPNSDAEIRNAVVSNLTFDNAVVNNSLALVDRALDCNDSNACRPGECVDSLLGVLCECLEDGECLSDGGELSLSLKSPPDAVTYSPDTVSYELEISSAATGTTFKIWDLGFEGGDLDLDVVPSSGVLRPGGSIPILVSGVPSTRDVGGKLTNSFYVNSHSMATADIKLDVSMTLYLCPAYAYAMPVDGGDDHTFLCEQCATIRGNEGVNCTTPGATQASLPILRGFWQSGTESIVIRQCLHPEACAGATNISDSNDYCADGYKGPYCAVCTEGYGRSLSNVCHSCNGFKARMLIVACAVSFSVVLLLVVLAVVFLIGGVDALDLVRQSTRRKLARMVRATQCCPPVARGAWSTCHSPDTSRIHAREQTLVAQVDYTSSGRHGNSGGGDASSWGSTLQLPENDNAKLTRTPPLGAVDGVGGNAKQPRDTRRHLLRPEPTSPTRSVSRKSLTGTDVSGALVYEQNVADANGRVTSIFCLVGRNIHRWGKRLPLNKFRIAVGVWQILAVFSVITGAEFPAPYALFLSWINLLNFDLGYIFNASCILPSVNFYQRPLATTLGPLFVAAALVWTYRIANGRAGIGSAGVIAKKAAWSRHLSAGLLITFMVFTSASSMVFNTFPCDDFVVDGESYLIADYSISCDTPLHSFFQAYAAVMVLVYPVGIPALYSVILWKHRDLLNPGTHAVGKPELTSAAVRVTVARSVEEGGAPIATQNTASEGLAKTNACPIELEGLEEMVKARAEHPDLAPFMFLWRDFDPKMYYYEVIECGRRIFLTDVLIFIAPHTVTQAAIGCIFAFVNLLVFELMRPHLDPTDSWLYRLGCVLIFLTMFLAMMIKMGAAEEGSRSMFAICLIALNVGLLVAVLWLTWRHMVCNSSKAGDTPT